MGMDSLLRDVSLKGKWKPASLVYIERQIKLRTIGVKSQRSSPFTSCILDNVNKSELLQMLTSAFRLFFYKCLLLLCNWCPDIIPGTLNSAWAARHVAISLLLCCWLGPIRRGWEPPWVLRSLPHYDSWPAGRRGKFKSALIQTLRKWNRGSRVEKKTQWET